MFGLSGAAGLMYESVWSRYLGLFVGHTAYAQVLVLTIFLGGMALGALLVSRYAERFPDPLLAYAGAEGIVGLIGLVFHDAFQGITGLAYGMLFPALGPGAVLVTAKWTIAALILLPQSVLLGATFPLMAAGVMRRFPSQPGRWVASLYFVNGLGGAVGVLVAGFVLLGMAGLPGTVLAAAIINLGVAVIAWSLARSVDIPEASASAPAPDDRSPALDVALEGDALTRGLLVVSFGTAAASFFYEIGWLRMLALAMGSATHAFELMLSAFILGLASGAFWIRSRADRLAEPMRVLGMVQWIMGGAALVTIPVYAASFGWTADLLGTFARTDGGYTGFNLARYGVALLIMFPATFCAGITLPLITRTLLVAGAGERSIGAVYGVNTLGAIVGTAAAGLVSMPWLGMRLTVVTGAALDMMIGVGILWLLTRRTRRVRSLATVTAVATVATVVVVASAGHLDRRLLMSGVFRHGSLSVLDDSDILYFDDGRTATVASYRSRTSDRLTIATNGKPDGSLPSSWMEACSDQDVAEPLESDAATQVLLPLLTFAHAPHAQRAAIVGQGTGMSSHTLLAAPDVAEVTTVEIEPSMVEGSRTFYPANRRVFDDERSTIRYDDARTFFASAGERFDIIVSEPSNPWVSGVASLFTEEFYRRLRQSLSDSGVLGQWLHLYEIEDRLVLSVLAGIHRVFPDYALYLTNGADMLIVASASGELAPPDWDTMLSVAAPDLCRARALAPAHLEATRLADRRALAPLLDEWEGGNSDYFPTLDLGAERARYQRRAATGFQALATDGFDLTGTLTGRRTGPLSDAALTIRGHPRLTGLHLGALLVHGREPGDSIPLSVDFRTAEYREYQWRTLLASDQPPDDWEIWAANFRSVEEDRFTGVAGVDAPEWYDPIDRFLTRHAGPPLARAVVEFQRGLRSWDFARASAAADVLVDAGDEVDSWIPPVLLVEGGVVARLRDGDIEGASTLWDELRDRYDRPVGHLRRALIESLMRLIDE